VKRGINRRSFFLFPPSSLPVSSSLKIQKRAFAVTHTAINLLPTSLFTLLLIAATATHCYPPLHAASYSSAKVRVNAIIIRRRNLRSSAFPQARSRATTPGSAPNLPTPGAQRGADQAPGSDSTSGAIAGQTSGIIPASDPRIQTMIARYPFIDTTQLANIFKNDFRAVNIFKLVNDHISNPASKQDLRITRFGELRAHDDDVTQQDLKGMVSFLRCLGVYNQCLIEAVNEQLRHSLQAS